MKPCKVTITMEDLGNDNHHLNIEVDATNEEEVRHMFTHIIEDTDHNKLGDILRQLIIEFADRITQTN